jgi:hypothetical protein
MFRDTFAVELLLAGVPLDQVSLLLGHSSVKITGRHYAPFCKPRQEQLATSVKLAWKKPRNLFPRRKNPQIKNVQAVKIRKESRKRLDPPTR